MLLPHFLWFFVLQLLVYVHGQTETVVDPDTGNTLVEDVTINPVNGLPTTQILETLTAGTTAATATTATTATTAAATTATAPNQGPVPQPAPSTAAGAIPYVYTTTNAAGATIAVNDIFTPSFAATTPFTPSSTGTILPYSEWLTLVGTNTVKPNVSSAEKMWRPSVGLWGVMMSAVIGSVTGAWLVFA